MSTMCGCGHDMERHNDIPDGNVQGWFGGNCRMCKCEAFARVAKTGSVYMGMDMCDKHSYTFIKDWGCPHCYKEDFDKKRKEVEPPSEGDVNDYDLRHLNS